MHYQFIQLFGWNSSCVHAAETLRLFSDKLEAQAMDVILLMFLFQIRYKPNKFCESNSGRSPLKLPIFSNVRRAMAGEC